jgi:hypothetical protein
VQHLQYIIGVTLKISYDISYGTIDLGLFFWRSQDSSLIEYADVGYLSDSQNAISLHGGTAISWKSAK